MKKILVVFLTLSMVLSLAGCVIRDDSQENSGGNVGGTASSNSPANTREENDEKTQGDNKEDPGPSETAEPDNSQDDKERDSKEDTAKENLAFVEMTVVDNEQCTVRFTGIEEDNFWGYAITAYLENKSADKTYMFSVRNAAINGVQTEPYFATEVAPGKKANDKITFSDDLLSEYGVEKFTDIEIVFRVYDSNDWTADPVAEETVHVYPYGEDKAELFSREPQETDTVIVDNDEITVIVTGYEEDDIWGYTLNLYLVNKTDKELMFSVDEASVNGFMSEPFWANSVSAGKILFTSISWSDSTFEENGITSVEEIEMKLRAYDANNWTADDVYNEVVKITP